MDENEIFKNPAEVIRQSESSISSPVTAPVLEGSPAKPSFLMPFGVFKILLGIVIVLAIIFITFVFVLPKFSKVKESKIILTYWGLWEDTVTMAPIIADFEKENPGIVINYSKQDIKEYRERLTIRSRNGNGPDVFRFHNSWVPQLSDILLPFPESIITKKDLASNYYPVVKDDLVKAGAIYGIPLQMDTLSLFINKDIFEAAGLKAPTSWIDFMNYSRKMTVKDENNKIQTAGAALGTYDNINHAPDIMAMLFAQDGVDLRDMSSNISGAIDALKFNSSFALPPDNVWDDTLDQSIKAFASGSLAMYFGYSWDYIEIKSLNPNLSFEVHPVPNLPGQNLTIASYLPEGVSGKSKNQKEALLFVKYLARKETAQKLFAEGSKARGFGEPYARVDLADSLKNSAAHAFVSSAPFAISSFFISDTYDNGINSKSNAYLKDAVNSVLKGTSPQSAAETLSQGVAQVLKQYGQ